MSLNRYVRYLSIQTILLYVDEPQLFVAIDVKNNSTYLCLLAEQDEHSKEFPPYLAVEISAERLSAFYAGELDLREIMTTPENKEWWLIYGYWGKMLIARQAIFDVVPERYLPEKGFYCKQTGK